ncbi:MAG: YkvA family protein [Gemmatimonadetes bacterium]|nr:YkvA family protein [Gemmatimonadota bacterium]MCY3943955.1 YkvA family protein [Gemmatimonadota bacterium]
MPPRKVCRVLRRGIGHHSGTSFRKKLAELAAKVGPGAVKLGAGAAKAGKGIVRRALVLYHCLQDPDTPAWARKIIMGALAYLVLPVDAVPDFLPVVGQVDDLAVLAAAFAIVLVHIKPEHRRAAEEKMEEWFGAEESVSDE